MNELLTLFVAPLERGQLRYLIGGSVAAMLYSVPRLTIDIDIPIWLTRQDSERFPDLFPAPAYYCPPADVLALETSRDCRGHFNVIHVASGLKADFYPSSRDPLFGWAWQNRRVREVATGSISVAPPEYVILKKLEYYREGKSEKHVKDIRHLLEVSGNDIDRIFLLEAIRDLRLETEWELCADKSTPGS